MGSELGATSGKSADDICILYNDLDPFVNGIMQTFLHVWAFVYEAVDTREFMLVSSAQLM